MRPLLALAGVCRNDCVCSAADGLCVLCPWLKLFSRQCHLLLHIVEHQGRVGLAVAGGLRRAPWHQAVAAPGGAESRRRRLLPVVATGHCVPFLSLPVRVRPAGGEERVAPLRAALGLSAPIGHRGHRRGLRRRRARRHGPLRVGTGGRPLDGLGPVPSVAPATSAGPAMAGGGRRLFRGLRGRRGVNRSAPARCSPPRISIRSRSCTWSGFPSTFSGPCWGPRRPFASGNT